MLVALILSLGLQTLPETAEALERVRCRHVLRTLDARVNRSARVDWRYVGEVRTITAVRGHIHRYGAWPAGDGLLGVDDNGLTAEQDAATRREAEAADVAALSLRLDQCLVRYPIARDAD